MSYEIWISEPAEKRLKKFDLEIQRRFRKKISKLIGNPCVGKPMRMELTGAWELYFEKSFRILYRIDEERKRVTVELIMHKDEF